MTLAEKIFALHAVFPFSQLQSEELLIVATAFFPRRYAPGQVICPVGESLSRLYVRVAGDLVDDHGTPLQPVVGTPSLLTGLRARFTISAGPEGYHALLLPRGKLFTVINECPLLLAGFFQIPLLGIDYARPEAPKP